MRREALELARVRLGERRRVAVAFRCREPDPDQAFGKAHRAGHPIKHRNAGLLCQIVRKIRHAGAPEHDRLGAILCERTLDLRFDPAPRIGA